MSMQPILHSYTYALDFLREQVADVPPEGMALQPAGIANHPAWVIGHLTYTFEMLGGAIGLDPWLPESFVGRYGAGSVPVADPAFYESKADALAMLDDAQSRMTAGVEALSESQLNALFPDPQYRDVFPTIRHAITQVLVGHTAYHVGQLNLWRRATGLPRLDRSFE